MADHTMLRPHFKPPWCNKCNKQVDEFLWDAPVDIVHGWQGSAAGYRGDLTITVKCHGEVWRTTIFPGQEKGAGDEPKPISGP